MQVALIIGLAILFNGGANILIKLGMNSFPQGHDESLSVFQLIGWAIQNPYLVGGVVSYALALVAYAYGLSKLELSVAYPIMVGMSYVLVLAASWLFLGETFNLTKAAGVLLVFAGLVLLVTSQG